MNTDKHRWVLSVFICVHLWFLSSCGPRTTSEDAKAYASSIEFRNVRLSASESYAGQTVHYLRIDVVNKGGRKVKELQVVLYFRDAIGKVVLTENAVAISPRHRPLEPGETRMFRQGFDPPADWNRVSPNIGIAYLALD